MDNAPSPKIVIDDPGFAFSQPDLGKTATPEFITFQTTPSGAVGYADFTILPLVPENSPVLVTPTKPFEFVPQSLFTKGKLEQDPIFLAMSLFETMFKNKGLGLAAPQCGIPLAVIVLGMDRDNKQVMFNPVIVQQSEETSVSDEGCLSYPHLFVKVKRSQAIRVAFQDATGAKQVQEFVGLTARVIQHEIDHLRGRVFWETVGPTTLTLARNRRKKLAKKAARR